MNVTPTILFQLFNLLCFYNRYISAYHAYSSFHPIMSKAPPVTLKAAMEARAVVATLKAAAEARVKDESRKVGSSADRMSPISMIPDSEDESLESIKLNIDNLRKRKRSIEADIAAETAKADALDEYVQALREFNAVYSELKAARDRTKALMAEVALLKK